VSAPESITFICDHLSPPRGTELATARLARALASDLRVEVIAVRGGIEGRLSSMLADCHVLVGRPAWTRLSRLATSSSHAEAVVVVGLWAASEMAVLGGLRNRRVVVWEHTLLENRLSSDRRVRNLARWASRFYRRAWKIVAVSAAVERAVSRFTGADASRVITIPNLLEDSPVANANVSWVPGQIVCMGTLNHVKNQELAIRALCHLEPHWRLCLVGDGPKRDELESLVRQLGLATRVEFAGSVDDVSPYLASADVLAVPSFAETFGLAVLEASAVGVPVACLDVEALNEVVPDLAPGVRTSEHTPSAFANAVKVSAGLRSDRQGFARALAARRARFDTADVVQAWRRLLVPMPISDAS
jgi:glycosyltransferase involved in cell wall biosynthesis